MNNKHLIGTQNLQRVSVQQQPNWQSDSIRQSQTLQTLR
jgi:hypothetical protein